MQEQYKPLARAMSSASQDFYNTTAGRLVKFNCENIIKLIIEDLLRETVGILNEIEVIDYERRRGEMVDFYMDQLNFECEQELKIQESLKVVKVERIGELSNLQNLIELQNFRVVRKLEIEGEQLLGVL